MVVHIKNRKTGETAFGPYQSMSTARRAFMTRGCDAATFLFDDDAWRDREAARDNLVDLTQFGLMPIPDHFLHVSVKDDANPEALMVSFTLNEAKGRADRQESGRKIGRYLKEFFLHLTDDEITSLSGQINGRYNKCAIKIARTRQEIRTVYLKSGEHCNSCMTYRMSQYSHLNQEKDVYPVEAYNGPDLAVAYTTDRYDRVTARAIIWPEKKRYGRIYGGDPDRFRTMLKDMGYERGEMTGARMTPIPLSVNGSRHYFAMPYVDGDSQSVSYDGEFFYIGYKDGLDSACSGTSGYIEMHFYKCILTGERMSSSVAASMRNGRGDTVYYNSHLAGSDLWNEHVRSFSGRNYYMNGPDSDYYTAVDGTKFPVYEAGSSYHVCAHDGKYYKPDEMIEGYHFSNLLKHYVRCEMTGRLMKKDNPTTVKMAHGAYWYRSAFRSWGRVGDDGLNYSTIHEQLAEAA